MKSSLEKISTPWLIFAGVICCLLLCGIVTQGRVPWQETTRRKFLLYDGQIVELYGEKRLEQTFIANYPGLSQIDILFKGDQTNINQTVQFQLKQSCAAPTDIFATTIQLPNIDDFAFQPVDIPLLDDSTGQSYCLVLQAPEATEKSAVTLQLSTGDLYPHGGLIIYNPKKEIDVVTPIYIETEAAKYQIYLPLVMNSPQAEGPQLADIGFRLHYQGRVLPTTQIFIERLTANKPYIWGQPWFYIGLVLVYGLLLVGLFYVARTTISLR